jgi:hypothetical protein
VLACTVTTVNHLAGARVLARSFAEHHPGSRLAALLVDDVDGTVGGEPFDALHPSDVGIDAAELHRMALIYERGALACALKAWIVGHLLEREPVVFLDADCVIWAGLEPLVDAATAHGVALTAHSLTPHPVAGAHPTETMFLRHGTFNSGVLAVGPSGREFVDWWTERNARHCTAEAEHGLSVDQGWLSLVPALFDHAVIDDPGVNVMGWNVHDRDVSWNDGAPTVPGGPVRCFHFAGSFDPHAPERFGPGPSGRDPWPPVAERPGVARLCADYSRRLLEEGYDEVAGHASPYATLPGGSPIDELMRTVYREALLAHESGSGPEPPNPFTDGDAHRFLAWLAASDDGAPSRYLRAIRARRVDLVEAFPEVPGADEERLVRWSGDAAARGEIDLSWVP